MSRRRAVRDAALAALRREAARPRRVETGGGSGDVFLEVFPRQPRLVIFGGVHIAVALVPLARALGYRTIVADGRPAFLTRERFPDADELILAWPEEAFERIGLDASCYVCILSHDPKFDEPALELALRSPGALRRRDRLAEDAGIPSRAAQGRGIRRRERSPGCTGRSGWTWAGASPPRRRWRFWRR